MNGAALHLALALGARLILREDLGELRQEPAADAHPHRLIHAACGLPCRRRERNSEVRLLLEEALQNLRNGRGLPRSGAARNDGKRLGNRHFNRLLLKAVGARSRCDPVDGCRNAGRCRSAFPFRRLLACEPQKRLREHQFLERKAREI